MVTLNLALILKGLFYIYLGSSIITLLFSRFVYPAERLDLGNIIACFIPPANIMYTVGIIVSLVVGIYDWFKDLFEY